MKLGALLADLPYEIIQGEVTRDIKSICWDSRKAVEDSLFICVKNRNVDRHDYALEAVKRGATALVVEHEVLNIPQEITIVKVDRSRKTMADIADRFYDEPSKKLKLIGVTGTNGKTSITYFVSKILEGLDIKSGLIGTIENSIGGVKLETEKLNPTTPDSIELQSTFSEILEKGASHAVMEVTSAALEQERVHKCDFDIGIFTNLTQDHLDEHGTMENYKRAKMKLFKMCKIGIINLDDAISQEIIQDAECNVITYGIGSNADYKASYIKYSYDGIRFLLSYTDKKMKVSLKLQGEFNVYNALASIAVCNQLGFTLEEIIGVINNLEGVPGRFQMVPNNKGILSIVDYAHSPDSLENILTSVSEISKGRIILVFGCGGNRDKTKRPIMGEIAGRYADHCIITSDNPRMESPMDIIEDIEKGILKTNCSYEKIEDRKTAIIRALGSAEYDDVVIVAGKGHENYQILENETIHFSDYECIMEYFTC